MNLKKYIFALSNATYRGVELYKTADGRIGFVLGKDVYSAANAGQAKACIDEWYSLKKN